AQRMRRFLNLPPTADWEWMRKGEELLAPGHKLSESELLFDKIDDDAIQTQLDKLAATAHTNTQEKQEIMSDLDPARAEATFEDFQKMDIRVATITAAEKVKKADKLLQLTVETGLDTRTVVSGIAEHYSPEEVVGK